MRQPPLKIPSAKAILTAAKRGLPPIGDARARVLILGTLPGDESLRRQQYYGHPRNHFWPLMAELRGVSVPDVYAERMALLADSGFMLWDVLRAAERIGSLDSAIRNAIANDFVEFFRRHPAIDTIAFNGQKAQALFARHVGRDATITERAFNTVVLPSSSPAYVRPFAEKAKLWRDALDGGTIGRQKRRAK